MCNCYGMYPYWAYSPFQYPTTYATTPSYAIPLGYVYAPPVAPASLPAPPVYFANTPARGEYKTGNCLMICQ
ncbi:MAG TPA: hypothetical protein VEG61_05420 [Candidatus Dormibacteraeota bacterium]|nr:hypothetical protein [Candidatus Dormibacteraeota bacterium]